MNINDVLLKGNLARDPEVKTVSPRGKQTTVCNITLAVSRNYQKQDGEWKKDVVFVPCEVWDSGAVTLAEKCCKGDLLLVKGLLKSESWEVEGKKHSRIKVRINQFELLPRIIND